MPRLSLRPIPLVLTALLAACSPRGAIVTDPSAALVGTPERIVVATSRDWVGPPQFFGADRGSTVNFGLFDVSVPPDRKTGTIKYPSADHPDPRTEFMVTAGHRIDSEAGYIAAINESLVLNHTTDATIFVHGFNTDFAEGLYREAQLMHDAGRRAAAVHFAWASRAKADGYLDDLDNALYSRPALQTAIEGMVASRAQNLFLAAHSMGTFLMVDTLRTMALTEPDSVFAKIRGVVLISADVDVGLFKQVAPLITARGVPIFLLVSDRDKALEISAKLRGQRDRLGSIRSTAELGGLKRVYLINATDLKSGDALDHFSEAESPALLDYLKRLNLANIGALDRVEQGGLEGGVTLAQAGARLILSPLTGIP